MKKSTKIGLGVGGGLLALVGGVYVAGYFIAGNQLPANASVDGVAIGGLSAEEARATLETELGPRVTAPLTLTNGTTSATLDPAASGLGVDYDATVSNAGGGFSWNPATIIATFTGGGPVDLVRTVDESALESAVEATSGTFAVDAVDATLAFEDAAITRTDAVDAQQLDVPATAAATSSAFEHGASEVEVVTDTTAPAVTDAMVDEAVATFAEPLLSGPITLTLGEESMEVEPASLAAAATFETEGDKLVGKFDAEALLDHTKEARAGLKLGGAKDASFAFKDGAVVVVPAVEGQKLDEDAFVTAVEQAATASGDERTAVLKAAKEEPEFTTAEAEALGTFEVIGEFTTQYPHAAYRNTNLGRAASTVNGTVLMPGDIFSLNDTLGPRTAANGYVDGYVINGGRLVKEAGGGISQSATTLFNAAFFAGYKDIEHKPHSLYFDRYPAGREATVYYGSLDLRFQNDTEYPSIIQGYINKSSSGNRGSITFKIWSKRTYDKVISTELVKSNFYSGSTRTVTGDPSCEPQAPIQGFTVNWNRVFYKDGAVVRTEPFSWKYSAGDRIVCQ